MAKLKTGRHTSGLKEARKTKKRQKTNTAVKSRIKTLTKKVVAACDAKDFDKAKTLLNEAFSTIDKAAKKKIIHKNTASRKKARLSKKVGRSATS
ncbi:MAG: 30S ribosomal protein S20 [bacterium]